MACKHEGGTDPCVEAVGGQCKVYHKLWYEANRDSIAAKSKAFYQANRERMRAENRVRYVANRDKIKAYREANRDKRAAYRAANRERTYERNKARYEKYRQLGVCTRHPRKQAIASAFLCAECLYREHERGVRRLGRVNELSREQFMWLISQPCIYCKGPATGVDRVKNEFGYTILNSVPCCKTCNFTKLKSTIKAFIVAVNQIARYCPDYPKFKRRWIRVRKKLTQIGEQDAALQLDLSRVRKTRRKVTDLGGSAGSAVVPFVRGADGSDTRCARVV
jgi:hypothetical protein